MGGTRPTRQKVLPHHTVGITKDSQGDIWKTIVSKLDEANKNEDPNAVYKRFRLAKYEDDKKHMEHFYVAAYQFHKMALKWTATSTTTFHPLPLRTHSRPEDAIDHAELEKISLHLGQLYLTVFLSKLASSSPSWLLELKVPGTANFESFASFANFANFTSFAHFESFASKVE